MTVNVTNTVGANNTIVLDGSSKIPAFDGSLVTALNASAFSTGSLATARIDVGTTAGKVLQLDGSARMPALNATNLVNAPGPTVSTSDPAIDTNSTLGAKWINKTSGEVYILTDATTDENIWTNVGAGSGNIAPFKFPGDNYGYCMGGTLPTSNVIEKVSFTADGNATDVGDLTISLGLRQGCSSATHGYACTGGSPASNVIERFSFTTDGNSVDVGDTTSARFDTGSTSDETHGYIHADQHLPASGNIIERFAYAASSNSADVGDLTIAPSHSAGSSDPGGGYGYSHGGWYVTPSPIKSNVIERYAFAASANGSDVGDLASGAGQGGGASSTTHGYNFGTGEAGINNWIQKFAFAASANATDIGDLTQAVFVPCGVSATSYSYRMGGNYPHGGIAVNIIDKWPHASDTNATDVGDCTATKGYMGSSGCQY